MSTGIDIKKKLAILEEGANITTDATSIDFVGSGVNSSSVGGNVTVNIPGGSGTTTYYLNESVTQTPYKEFSSIATGAIEQIVPLTVSAGATSVIAEYLTPTGVPGTTQIPTGLWQFFLHFNAGVAGQNWIIRPEVYKRDLGGIETLLLTLDPVVVTNMSTTTTMYVSDAVFPFTTILTTDRILVRISMQNTTGVSQTVNFRTEGNQHYSVGLTTLNQVIPTGAVTSVTGTAPIVSSGGLTPAISIPQSSATVDGYLSSSDWSVFNAKQNAITLTTTGTSGASTLVGSTLNIPQYAGGLTYFTEAQSTAVPNATVNVDSLTAVASTTNADFVVRPKGTGAILAAIPDNAILGGNKRGANAVDLQTFRDATTQVASGAYSALIGGYANKATNLYDFAMGSYCTASGGSSVALGGSCNASGGNSLAFISQATSSGTFSFAAGRYAGASQTSAVAIGQNTSASGFYSLALGTESVSSNTTSISIGKATTADGISSLALGIKSHTFGVTGRQVFQSGDSATSGDAQKSTLILRRTTTDATASVLSVTGNATITSQIQLTLQNNNVFRVKGSITGKQSGSTNVGVWDIDCVIVRGVNAASTVIAGTPTVSLVVNTGGFGSPTLTANTTLGCLTVTVIGALATNVQWTCVIDTCETIYA